MTRKEKISELNDRYEDLDRARETLDEIYLESLPTNSKIAVIRAIRKVQEDIVKNINKKQILEYELEEITINK